MAHGVGSFQDFFTSNSRWGAKWDFAVCLASYDRILVQCFGRKVLGTIDSILVQIRITIQGFWIWSRIY